MQSLLDNKALMFGAGLLAIVIAVVLLVYLYQMVSRVRLRMPGGRTRQARLGIVDAFDLDRQRQLIIVRRDNTEHLIMIGGPNDLLIEAEISRVESRDGRRDVAGPALPPGSSFGSEPRIPVPLNAPDRVEAALAPIAAVPPAIGAPPQPVAQPLAPPPSPPRVAPTPQPQPQPVARQAPPPPPPAPAPQPKATSEAPAPTPVPPLNPTIVLAPAEGEAPARRTPTFPLPPRRPVNSPEPRPRAEPLPPPVKAAPGPAPAPLGGAPGTSSPEVIPPPARPTPPQFLRPLPPRTPKPAPRTEPVAPPPGPAAPPAAPQSAPADTLESLEEEMAKLLGRGGEG